MKDLEKRFISQEIKTETRTEGEVTERIVAGYAAVFNTKTKLSERVEEMIKPGAFSSSLGGDVRALWSHNSDMVIGRTKNGSLELKEDQFGLNFRLKLPDTQQGRDAYTLISQGFVTGVSFGFRVKKDSWTRGENNAPHLRTLEEVDLLEVSPTAFPAYAETSVSARSAEEILKEYESKLAWEENERSSEAVKALRNSLDILEAKFKLETLGLLIQ